MQKIEWLRGRESAPVPPATPTAFAREVSDRFGLVPNFFLSAPDAPDLVEKLWEFAKSGYLDNPIPSLFKERLFVYLSRFCQVRYCITRHCAFLVGYGHPSGDPFAPPQTIDQAIRLLKAAPPWGRDVEPTLAALEGITTPTDWPAPETELEDRLFSAATLVFVEPGRSQRARQALRHALGGRRLEHLLGLLAFIRTAHYWTVTHSDLRPEDDVQELLSAHEELAGLLLNDPEAARCEISTRLLSELEDLRGLHERRELENAKRALEALVAEKELLLKETNHRVKNSLQIVSSILRIQLGDTKNAEAGDAMRDAAARVMAIAAVHERLYSGDNLRVVSLDVFLRDLCFDIGRAVGCPNGIEVDSAAIDVPTEMAVPLALVVNELVTNVIKHVGPPCRVVMRLGRENELTLRILDNGQGPTEPNPRVGLGSRLVESFAKQLGAQIATFRSADGYAVQLTMPVPQS